jgi:C4-dicarboxylate-specific signal transduction histidine kinase
VLVQTGRVGLTAARHLVTKDGEFVGVTGADFELSTLEGLLQETAETSADTLTVFVVDSLGKMMASSVANMFLTPLLLSVL